MGDKKKTKLCYCTGAAVYPSWSALNQKLAVPPWRTYYGYFLLFTGSRWQKSLWTPMVGDCLKQWHSSGYIISFLLISFTKWLVLCDAYVSCWDSQTEAHPRVTPSSSHPPHPSSLCAQQSHNNKIPYPKVLLKEWAKLHAWYQACKCTVFMLQSLDCIKVDYGMENEKLAHFIESFIPNICNNIVCEINI